jgi:hypothetical protein
MVCTEIIHKFYYAASFSTLCVIHFRLLDYHTIYLLMTFYFQCYKTILIYFYFVIDFYGA